MGEVFATNKAKLQIDFESVDAEFYHNGHNDTLAQITYAFHDPPEQNW